MRKHVAQLRSGVIRVKELAIADLFSLAQSVDRQLDLVAAGAIEPLAGILRFNIVNPRARVQAAWILGSVCRNGAANETAIAKAYGIEPLVELLRTWSADTKYLGAGFLADLAFKNAANQVAIAAAGGIGPLVELLRNGSAGAQERAACALGNLAEDNACNQAAVAAAGGIKPLVALVQSGSTSVKYHATACLASLAQTAANQQAIAAAGGIQVLLELVRGDSTSAGAQQHATAALGNMACDASNKVAITAAGGIEPLVALVRSGCEGAKEKAAAALGNLSDNNDPATQAAIAAAGALEPLVALVRSGGARAQKNAAFALGNLAIDNNANKGAVVAAGGIEALVVLQRNGDKGTQEEAEATLRNLAANNAAHEEAIALAESEVSTDLLKDLAVKNAANQVAIAAAGGIGPLVELLRNGSAGAQERAACALGNLAEDNACNQAAVAAAGGIKPLVALVQSGSTSVKYHATACLASLAQTAANQQAIAAAGGIQVLLELVRGHSRVDDTVNTGAQQHATAALGNMACDASNKVAITAAGGIEPLVALVRSGCEGAKEKAAAALGNLSDSSAPATQAAIAAAGALEPLVALVRSGGARAQENAAFALGNLAIDNNANKGAVVAAGGIEALVVLQRNGDKGAQEEAEATLRNLAANNAAHEAAIARAKLSIAAFPPAAAVRTTQPFQPPPVSWWSLPGISSGPTSLSSPAQRRARTRVQYPQAALDGASEQLLATWRQLQLQLANSRNLHREKDERLAALTDCDRGLRERIAEQQGQLEKVAQEKKALQAQISKAHVPAMFWLPVVLSSDVVSFTVLTDDDAERVRLAHVMIASARGHRRSSRHAHSEPPEYSLISIERVCHPNNYESYMAQLKRLNRVCQPERPSYALLGDAPELDMPVQSTNRNLNEFQLFHGSAPERIDAMLTDRPDCGMAGSGAGTLFGNGLYLAPGSSKADIYSTPDARGHRKMLCVRSALARIHVQTQHYSGVRPPQNTDSLFVPGALTHNCPRIFGAMSVVEYPEVKQTVENVDFVRWWQVTCAPNTP